MSTLALGFGAVGLWYASGNPRDLGILTGAGQLQAAEHKFASREAEIADALEKNGPIFVDWPQPQLALVFSGEMDGYLEPCGCAGLENQKGGL